MRYRKAILIIHGFGGGTYDEEYIANRLELIHNFDVYSFTLPGHDTNATKIKMDDWIKSCEEHVEMLINFGYKNIYVIGHSMGGVMSAYIATKYKEIKKLVLAAPAFHYLKVENDKMNLLDSFKTSMDVIKEYSGEEVVSRFLRMPVNAVKEFVKLVKTYYPCAKDVNIPTLIIEGTKDIIVPMSSANYVYDSIKSKEKYLLIVKNINHDIFRSKRKEEVTDYVIKFLKSKNKNINIDKKINIQPIHILQYNIIQNGDKIMLNKLIDINPVILALLATTFTWFMTLLGASIVFFFKKVNKNVMDAMLGVASGVMIAASFWSLLDPGIELATSLQKNAVLIAIIGFMSGGIILFLGDKICDKILNKSKNININSFKRSLLLIISITLHNIPEGCF